jgi:hypothetical protein
VEILLYYIKEITGYTKDENKKVLRKIKVTNICLYILFLRGFIRLDVVFFDDFLSIIK